MHRPSPFSARDIAALLRMLDPDRTSVDFATLSHPDVLEVARILARLHQELRRCHPRIDVTFVDLSTGNRPDA